MAKFYISTPIYYINAKPHIGHAYTTIAADVLARYHRQHGDEVFFSVGTDENSQKTIAAAANANLSIGEYADSMAQAWKQVWDSLNINYDRFIRTTEPAHQQAVYALIDKINTTGDIYKGSYHGLYCEGCEGFIRADDLIDGKCPDHRVEPTEIAEENYFFKLSAYQQRLLDHIKENPEFIHPESRRNEVVAFIERGLDDFSISREGKSWGLRYPYDENHTIYVWVEALVNYLSAVNYPNPDYEQWWPADVHMVGKDIIKFHCVYWPAMLMSAGIELPKVVAANGFLNVDGTKISKSLGNTIDPLKLVEMFGRDALRYVILRDKPFGQDGDFTLHRFTAVYNSDLADDLGNLVSRVAAMISKYQDNKIGATADPVHDTASYHKAMKTFRFDKALDEVSNFTSDLNLYIEEEKPWKVAKTDPEHLQEILSYLAINLVEVATLLLPFMPETAQTIIDTFSGEQLQPLVGPLFPKYHETD